MSTIDTCPTKTGENEAELTPRDVSAATGKAYWRSLDDLSGTEQFKSFVHREFPAHASELLDTSRRSFLKIMGAGLALAGAATIPACRRPDHKILPYNKDPEHVVMGKPLYYATALPAIGGGAVGVLAETFEGRPVKLEGNPMHPFTQGKLESQGLASILGLYDPDRNPELLNAQHTAFAAEGVSEGKGAVKVTGWAEFEAKAKELASTYDANKGAGLVFLVEKVSSPTRDRMQAEITRRWPQAKWLPYSALDNDIERAGLEQAVGQSVRVRHHLEKAERIVSFGRDFLGDDGTYDEARAWGVNRFRAGTKKGHEAEGATMNRLYAIESGMTQTGGSADHRLPLKPSQVAAAAVYVAGKILGGLPGMTREITALAKACTSYIAGDGASALTAENKVFLDALVEDVLEQNKHDAGTAVLMAGPSQPQAVHALVAAVNRALGAVGTSVTYPALHADCSVSSSESVAQLARLLDGQQVDTLVVVGVNPAFTEPMLAGRLGQAGTIIQMGDADETAAVATMHLSRAHALETWGDVQHWDGTISIIQPTIKPLYGSHSEYELFSALLGVSESDTYTQVRNTLAMVTGQQVATEAFERTWRSALRDGIVPGTVGSVLPVRVNVNFSNVMGLVAGIKASLPNGDGAELVITKHPFIGDGAEAGNGWLQELPHAVTKVTWDNPLLMSAGTAESFGVSTSRSLKGPEYNYVQMATLTVGGRDITAPVWIQPGMPDGVIIAHAGYGRTTGNRVARDTGFNMYPLLAAEPTGQAATSYLGGATLKRARGESSYMIACTQDHWSMEGRAIVREFDLTAYNKYGDDPLAAKGEKRPRYEKDPYDQTRPLNMPGLLGIEAHSPTLTNAYSADQEIYYNEVWRDEKGKVLIDEVSKRVLPLREKIVARDNRGRYVVDPKSGHAIAKPREEWPTKKDGKEPKSDADRAKYWGPIVGKLNKFGRPVQQWGMSIDLTTCTGCGSCTTACQSENNIPIVGKTEVAKGREMSWIRVDRYYSGGGANGTAGLEGPEDVGMAVQPVACVHCEMAPCEVVCPVNATVHDEEGTNNMAYNRCVGTRYCSNNCPYKVRRFNYFDYATKQYKGDIFGVGTEKQSGQGNKPWSNTSEAGIENNGIPVPLATKNENFIPPRLRQKVTEVEAMKNNPHVTVRERGVMEKCSYCIQRINHARVETKLEDLEIIPDGWFQTACEAACPSNSIVFGDIYDNVSNDGKGSRVSQLRNDPRSYALLAYLNTRPRTTYAVRLHNPNTAIRKPNVNPFKHGDHGGHGDDHGGHDTHGTHTETKDAGHVMSLPVLSDVTTGALA